MNFINDEIFKNLHPRIFFHCFLEREEGREERKERNIEVRQKHQLVASCMSLDGELYAPGPGIELAN